MRLSPRLAVVLASLPLATALAGAARWQPLDRAHNVILIVPGGCPAALPALARQQVRRPLALDTILTGAVGGYFSATGAVCALSSTCGSPSMRETVRLAEAARRSGRAVGMVTPDDLTDLIPAALLGPIDRGASRNDVAAELAGAGFDLVIAGGRAHLRPRAAGGSRDDGRDLEAELRARGVTCESGAEAPDKLRTTPAWALLADGPLPPVLDRVASGSPAPLLGDLTRRAIDLLSRDPDGFLLIVGSGSIGDACAANDAAGAVAELLDVDGAVSQALAFANGPGRGRTLVVACPAYAVGGLSIIDDTPHALAALGEMRVSAVGLAARLGTNTSPVAIAANVRAWWNVRLDAADSDAIQSLLAAGLPPSHAIGEVVARRHTGLRWASHGPTADDVPLWSSGPGRLSGMVRFPADVGRGIAAAMGVPFGYRADAVAKPAE